LLTGAFFTWRNIHLAQESLRVSQEGQITDRFSKAIEQLGASDANGNKKLEVRLGGIYALERIANESERDHWPIMETLCTCVRENSPAKRKHSDSVKQALGEKGISADIQAILTVLGRRDRRYEKSDRVIDLSSADLNRAHLFGADLRGADLRWADLNGAHLSGADLRDAMLGWAGLIGADLSSADLRGASLFEADLRGAELTNAYLNGAHLSGADLSGADLLMARLHRAGLSEASNLTQAQIDKADGDSSTELPQGLHMPERWKK